MSQPGGGTGHREPVPTGTLIGAVGRPGGDDRRERVSDVSDIGAFLGLDVGKDEHHATAVMPAGKKAFDKRLANSEPKLREVFGKLKVVRGRRSAANNLPEEETSSSKRAFFLSAFAALADPRSRAYHDKKISQGKHHTQALLCLARRRADVLFAMLRDGTFYEPQPAPSP